MREDITPVEPGIYRDVPAYQYHAWDAFSITTGLELLKSPLHYQYKKQNPIEATDPMIFGTRVHMRVLEPELFWQRYAVMPDLTDGIMTKAGTAASNPRATSEYKERVANWTRENPGKVALDHDYMARIEAIWDALHSGMYDTAKGALCGAGDVELSLLWIDPLTGVRCKGRIDKYSPKHGLIADLKTTQDASYNSFIKTICNRAYHVQAAHYMDGAQILGLKVDHSLLIAAETNPPIGISVVKLKPEDIQGGIDARNKLLKLLSECNASGTWAGYPDRVEIAHFPDWAMANLERALTY